MKRLLLAVALQVIVFPQPDKSLPTKTFDVQTGRIQEFSPIGPNTYFKTFDSKQGGFMSDDLSPLERGTIYGYPKTIDRERYLGNDE